MVKEFLQYFFSELEKKSTHPKSTAQILMDELGISRGTAYKKIKGDVQLSLEEMMTLATRFSISLDTFTNSQSDQISFQYPALHGGQMSPWRFVDQLLGAIDLLSARPGFKIRYTTCEIPLLNYLYYPELLALKLYFYSNSVWDLMGNTRPGQAWIDDLLADSSFQDKRLRIFDAVANTPTEEYYQINLLDTTLEQVQFLRETKQATESFCSTIYRQMVELTAMLSRWAENGQKQLSNGQPGASYDLHINDLLFMNVVFLAENEAGRVLFNTFDSPNFMSCKDERVLDRMEAWFDRIKSKSTQVSRQNEKHRQVFFHEIQRRVFEAEHRR